ncbi:MAG TPA: PEP-CTERM sorting domain-containing protein [Candidatus Brocadiia bacterium]|nr:PEP-CTERM sorting domain-containing protein [Candidatus Brocadiia bacterium]
MKKTSITRLAAIMTLLAVAVSTASGDWFDDVGYTRLSNRLGANTPDGSGVAVGQVEAGGLTEYTPIATGTNPTLYNAAAPFAGITFHWETGYSGSHIAFWHAVNVARPFYGDAGISMTPGIDEVHCYLSGSWRYAMVDRGNNGTDYPELYAARIHNNSWVSLSGTVAQNQTDLLGIDRTIARDDLIVVNAVNNGSTSWVANSPVPDACYNGIAVGLNYYWDNVNKTYAIRSAHGGTGTNYGNFQKPDIVAPAAQIYTSYAAPVVSSAAAMMVQTANDNGITDGDRSVVVKAVLMAGAEKHHLWHKGAAGTSDDSTHPLDDYLGAGMVQVDESYDILVAGQQTAGNTDLASPIGWDYDSVGVGSTMTYYMEGSTGHDMSAILTWMRHDDVSGTIQNLDLRFYSASYSGSSYVLDALIQESVATTGNVENIWCPISSDGTYALVVYGPAAGIAEDYALAWVVPEPSAALLLAGGAFVLAVSKRRARRK